MGCSKTGGVADSSEIMEADRAFARATAENGAEGWVSNFAVDGIMVSGQTVVSGHDSIRALMTPLFADSTYSLEWEPRRAEVAISDDLGYTWGVYRRSRTDAGGDMVTETGSYLSVWRRGEDGEWKVVLDIGSPDDPGN
jgi:uncharacterized protein (TIGR02246 family)